MEFDYKQIALDSARKSSKETGKVEVYLCPVTDKEIYFKTEEGKVYPFESHGDCAQCKKVFHVSALRTFQHMDMSEWPVAYSGFSCGKCYDAPDLNKVESQSEMIELSDLDDEEE